MKLFILSKPCLDVFSLNVLAPLIDSDNIKIVGVCIDNRKPESNIKLLRREIKKGRGGYLLVMILNKLISKAKNNTNVCACEYFKSKEIPIHLTDKLYSHNTIEFIKDKKPDCIFRNGFGIIREPILSLAPKGVISYHHGNIRKYRGGPPGLWELYNNEVEMSVTVQALNEDIDTGKIVQEIQIPIFKSDNWKSLNKRAYEKSINMIYESCMLLEVDDFEPKAVKESELGKFYTLPNFRQWFTLQIKCLLFK